MRFAIIMLMLTVAIQQGWSQAQKILNSTVELNSAITTIKTDITGNFVGIETWPGNHVLLETKIELHGVSDGVLNHYMKEGRYAIIDTIQGNTLSLISQQKVRKTIKTKGGSECLERIHYRILIPESFKSTEKNTWTRPPEEELPQVVDQLDKKGN